MEVPVSSYDEKLSAILQDYVSPHNFTEVSSIKDGSFLFLCDSSDLSLCGGEGCMLIMLRRRRRDARSILKPHGSAPLVISGFCFFDIPGNLATSSRVETLIMT